MDEFLKFNKIKSLTNSVEDIKKAISNSELLAVSPDGTQVKRIGEIAKKEDADECTIYVEQLPKDATHDSVREIFSRYGAISYVSLPRFKSSRKIKEFGFIEFETPSGVEQAINAFKEFGGLLQFSGDPGSLKSITAFQAEQKGVTDVEDEAPPLKKARLDENSSNNAETEEESNAEEKVDPEAAAAANTQKKKRKPKKNKLKEPSDKIYDMKIMSKREWKRLRNKYLNLQREKIKEIKQKLQVGGRKKPETAKKVKIKTTSPRKINFYGAMQDRRSGSEDNVEEVPALKRPLFSFEPGLIVSLKFQAPCVDVKDFKGELKQFNYVKYVDLKEGDLEAFVRVDKVASANQLVKFYSNGEYQPQILSGEVEQIYWNKMLLDREKKLSKSVKLKHPRGREKLNKKIASHIRFEDN